MTFPKQDYSSMNTLRSYFLTFSRSFSNPADKSLALSTPYEIIFSEPVKPAETSPRMSPFLVPPVLPRHRAEFDA